MSLLETVTIKFTPAGAEEVESYYRKLANKIKNIAKGQQTSLGLSVADIKQLSNETTKSYNNQKNQIKQLERERTLANKKALVDLKAIDREDKVITAQKIANIKMTQRWEEAYSKQAILNSKKQLQQDISNIRLKEAANKNNLKQALVNSKLQLQQDLSNIRIKEAAEKAYLKSVQDLERSIRRQSEAEARRLATARNKAISGLGVTSQQLGLKEFSGVNLTSGVNAQRVAELQAKYNNLNQVMLSNGRITQSVFEANKLAIEKFSMSTVKAADKLKTGLTKEVGLMRSTFINLTRAFIAFQIASGFINLAKQIDTLSKSFRALKNSVNYGEIRDDLEAVSKMTGGAVSQYTSAGAINRAQMMGVDLSGGMFQNIALATTKIASATGADPTQMFADFTTAIAKASPIILDNSGIILKLEEAYKIYYERLEGVNKSYNQWVETLTQSEKNQIYMKIGIEKLNEKTLDMDLSVSKLTSGLGELQNKFNSFLMSLENSTAIGLVIKGLTKLIDIVSAAISKLDEAVIRVRQFSGEVVVNPKGKDAKQIIGELFYLDEETRQNISKYADISRTDTEEQIKRVIEYNNALEKSKDIRKEIAYIGNLPTEKDKASKLAELNQQIKNTTVSEWERLKLAKEYKELEFTPTIEQSSERLKYLEFQLPVATDLLKTYAKAIDDAREADEKFNYTQAFGYAPVEQYHKTKEGVFKKEITGMIEEESIRGRKMTPEQAGKLKDSLRIIDTEIARKTNEALQSERTSIAGLSENMSELVSNQNRFINNEPKITDGVIKNIAQLHKYSPRISELATEYTKLKANGEDTSEVYNKLKYELDNLDTATNRSIGTQANYEQSIFRVAKTIGISSQRMKDLIAKMTEYKTVSGEGGSVTQNLSDLLTKYFVKPAQTGVSKIKDLLKEWLDIKREAEKALMGSQRREIADAEDVQRDRIDRLNELFKSLNGVSREISTVSFDGSKFGTASFYQNLDKMEQSIKSLSPELLKQMYKVDTNELNNIISNLKVASKNILEKISEENQRKIAEMKNKVGVSALVAPELNTSNKNLDPIRYLADVKRYTENKASLEIISLNATYDRERKEIEKNWVDGKEKTEALRLLKVQSVLDTKKIEKDSLKERADLEAKLWDIAREQQKKYWDEARDRYNEFKDYQYSIAQRQISSPETTTVKSRFGTFSSQQGMFTDQKEALANLYSNATPEFQRFVSLTNDGLEKTREYFTDLSESGRKEIDLLIEALDNLSLKASEPFEFLKNVAKEALMSTAQAISQYAWQSTIGFTDMQTAAKEDRRVAIADLQEQRNQNMVDEATYKNKLATIDENYAIKQVQYEKQARKQLLLGLGQQFYAKGTGYLIDSVVSFARGNIARGGAEALAGTAMVGLGAGLGYAGASITVPQASSNSDAANSGGKDQYFNINANLFEDKLQFGRVGSKTIIRG